MKCMSHKERGLFKWPNANAVKKSHMKRRIVVGYVTSGFVMIVP